ncbi:MAG: hypothetical protein U9R02_04865 [Thermodesulfobacteriota bacterium]|nr:hypothetical protein [Thermodesulfobacteriota bacterium]
MIYLRSFASNKKYRISSKKPSALYKNWMLGSHAGAWEREIPPSFVMHGRQVFDVHFYLVPMLRRGNLYVVCIPTLEHENQAFFRLTSNP